MNGSEPILSVRHLSAAFEPGAGAEPRPAVDDVSFDVGRGRILAMVGQCGSGKTLTALAILGLLPGAARLQSGRVLFDGRDLLALPEREMQRVRGRSIAMVFQEPATALSPVHTVGWQLCVALAATGQIERRLLPGRDARARARAAELLARVGLPEPARTLDTYPHQLSAGMRRRVLLALAIAGNPRLLIADEPTTGLDATIQSQIIDLLAQLNRESGMSVLLITHDLSSVAELATDVVVMYAGQIVEAAPVGTLFEHPQHPYTRLLLEGSRRLAALDTPLAHLPQQPTRFEPSPRAGCRFADGCPERNAAPREHPRCEIEAPSLQPENARHRSRCFYPAFDEEEGA